ncbi:hypothetical protein F0562_036076 [Nyssa sinensis]|uniref:C3H1-type domain-containing protein n=1 Tax=Nyssa sinensis TaxID=561372 RepID=A0A5J5AHV5_9ASTE|nr:hypothetical protein F0562_036076 [Nyssa sinensis]
MRGLPESKRVSWASDEILCQVRLFLLEESPSQVGLGVQDHLQAKTSLLLHSTGVGADNNLPPGFEGAHPTILLRNKLSQIPLVRWKCPPRFVLDVTWRVVAGEESKEVEVQTQREMRVLEAVYPRTSAIPPNPSVLAGMEDSYHNDQHTPLIPITSIEDEDAAADTSFDSMTSNIIAMSSHPPQLAPRIFPASQCGAIYSNPPTNGNPAAGMALGVEPSVAVPAYAALNAVMSDNDQGNLINGDLLAKILSDPQLIEKLVTDHGAAINQQIIPKPRSPGTTSSDLPSVHINRTEVGAPSLAPSTNLQILPKPRLPRMTSSDLPSVHINRTEVGAPSLAATSSGPFYSPANRAGPSFKPQHPPEVVPVRATPAGALVVKDINYYKSLIQQHGGERQEILPQFGSRHTHQLVANPESVNTPKPRVSKPKIMKPCIYYNSSRGCRHGANCSYQHDALSEQRVSSMPEVQSAKRIKVDREITGT